MSDFIAKLVAMLKAIFTTIFGGLKEGATEIAGDVRRAAGFTRRAAEATTRLVGRGLTGPAIVLERTAGAVGGILGALVPRPAPTAAQVAEDAIANDNPAPAASRRSYVPEQMGLGERMQAYARAMQKGDASQAARMASTMTTSDAAWLAGLDPVAIGHLTWMSAIRIEEHVGAQNALDRSPLLPPVQFVPDAPATVARNIAYRRLARKALAECAAPLPSTSFGR